MLQAQTFAEWFQQRKTQIRYLVNQIGALQIYIEFARKGYEIADAGLQTIGNIKDGDFKLHRDFFRALEQVSPSVRNSVAIADIIALQVKLVEKQSSNIARSKSSPYLWQSEIDYIVRVYFRVVEKSLGNMEELTALLSAGEYVMSDDERLRRIGELKTSMQEQYSFVRWFGDQTDLLVVSRSKEQQEGTIGGQLLLK
jgi:hypothetical protein